ncbi:gag protease polyprotein [Cucumis melo var. makuwa]|uniref:Gag protease polyprotein n=1 Tax=Cucumis melo var. makuwa TaxID=1194695 RepID=A0A5D3DQS4_CUCMM|nr:gag protease polyprotein [Cucumis melo var. makuwa]TYK26027.1 gag protease polyprotein [Cucumis melo var. makuwa]
MSKTGSYLSFLEGIRDLTFKFSGPRVSSFGDSSLYSVDSLSVDSIKRHNQVSGKGFLTTGPQIEARNVTPMLGCFVHSSYVNRLCCTLELIVDGLKSLKVRLTYDVSLCFVSLWLKRSLPLVRRGARRDGRGGRGREAGRVQPEVQPVAQATDPAAPVVPDQLSTEAKHLRDFRKYNPTTFDGSLEDPTKAQLWLSFLETIFLYMKCPEDQKVQYAVFMLTDRGTACLRDAKRQEFLNLEQGHMTVEQYDAQFDMLSRFALEMIATEAAKADNGSQVYRRGLTRPRLQVEVRPQDRKGRLSNSLFQCHNGTSDQVVSFAVSSRSLLRQGKLPEGNRCVPLVGSTIWAVVYSGPGFASSVGKRGIQLIDAR